MTDVPQELLDQIADKNVAQLKHRWLWSFMPAETRVNGGNGVYKTVVFLVGFCPTCNTTLSTEAPINNDGSTNLSQREIPKWGCVPIEEL